MEDWPSMLMWSVAEDKTNLSIQNLSIFPPWLVGRGLTSFLRRGQRSLCLCVCPVVRCCTSTDRIDRLNITMFLKEFSFFLYSWILPHFVPCVPALLFMYFSYLLGLFVVFCWTTLVGIILCSTPFYLDLQLPLDILCCLACLCYQHKVVFCSLYLIVFAMSAFESSTPKCDN